MSAVKSKRLRPVVAVWSGMVVAAFPGCGLPVVVDEVAQEALAKGARKVDLEVLNPYGDILEVHVLYEEDLED